MVPSLFIRSLQSLPTRRRGRRDADQFRYHQVQCCNRHAARDDDEPAASLCSSMSVYYATGHLEFSGQYEAVLADDMMNDHPHLHHPRARRRHPRSTEKTQVRILYRNWAETNQCVFYIEDEHVAVADNFVASSTDVVPTDLGQDSRRIEGAAHPAQGAHERPVHQDARVQGPQGRARPDVSLQNARAVVLAL